MPSMSGTSCGAMGLTLLSQTGASNDGLFTSMKSDGNLLFKCGIHLNMPGWLLFFEGIRKVEIYLFCNLESVATQLPLNLLASYVCFYWYTLEGDSVHVNGV